MEIKNRIILAGEKILDYAQVACPSDHWKALRSKILREINNCIRDLEREKNG